MRLSERIRKGAPYGERGFQLQLGKKSVVMKFVEGAISFQFVLTGNQWEKFLGVLESSFRRPRKADAYAGFIFSVGQPIVCVIKPGRNADSLEGKLGFKVRRPPEREIAAVRKTHWANPVQLDYRGLNFLVKRPRFLRIRSTCLEFERIRLRG